jgi:hypothetical protein
MEPRLVMGCATAAPKAPSVRLNSLSLPLMPAGRAPRFRLIQWGGRLRDLKGSPRRHVGEQTAQLLSDDFVALAWFVQQDRFARTSVPRLVPPSTFRLRAPAIKMLSRAAHNGTVWGHSALLLSRSGRIGSAAEAAAGIASPQAQRAWAKHRPLTRTSLCTVGAPLRYLRPRYRVMNQTTTRMSPITSAT